LTRRIGDFQLGPEIKNGNVAGPLNCIKVYLAKKNDEFYRLKVLTVDTNTDDRKTKELEAQGKILLHNEFVLLEILRSVPGIERCHGMFVDYVQDETTKSSLKTKTLNKRITLIFDPVCDKLDWMNVNSSCHNVTLQEFISRQRLSEREALLIFYDIVKVVERIHQIGIIHRDLKLQNFLINVKTRKVTLTNFCLGKLLSSDDQLLLDQRGSPAYISPDILNGAYKGKVSSNQFHQQKIIFNKFHFNLQPTDIWTLGVILYILIYANFPFVENTTTALFKKICQCELVLPTEVRVSEATKKLIKCNLLTTSNERFNATETREYLEKHFEKIQRNNIVAAAAQQKDDQVVPDVDNQPPKLICQDPPSPKFDLSTENMSMVLKFLSSPTSQQENKMYLKPSLLAERGSNRIQISPQNSPSGSLGVTRNLTRQINNLSVRNRQQNPSLSWHNRIGGLGIYEVRYRPAEISNINSSFETIFHTLNELFSSGNFPSTSIVNEFQGNINPDIALKLSIWLRTNFNENPLVREIYSTSTSPGSNVEKFVEFLRRCHVEMEVINGQVYVKQQQSNKILIFLTYLLQLAGYNNNYFLNLSRGS
jgi:serine/threonine-protein kinase 40